jgi:hypothetical protein
MAHPSVVDDYLAYCEVITRFGVDSRQAEVWRWAEEELSRLVHAEPNTALEIIRAVISEAPNDAVLAFVAAGPLEDLLSYHGEVVIELVERFAAIDEWFRRALSGVWGENSMSPGVQARVAAAIGDIKRL